MNEEMMEVVEVMDEAAEAMQNCPTTTACGNSMSNTTKVLLIGGAILTGGVSLAIAFRHKIKDQVKARRINKLESEGYTVLPPVRTYEEIAVNTEEETK